MAMVVPSRTTPSSPMQQQRLGSFRSASFRIDDGDAVEAAEAMTKFAQDPVFSRFLSDDFNATQFASDALRSGSATASADKLQEGIQLLGRQLRHEVVLRHGELLQQLSSLRDMEGALTVVRAGVGSLQGSGRRIRSEVAEPYKAIKSKSRQVSCLHDTIELLRAVVRVLRQLKRLRELVESSGGGGVPKGTDLSKAAQLFSEIEGLRRDADLTGVEIVDAEVPWLVEAGNRIRSEAMKSLEAGMEALNQAEVGSALQVFYNMGELKPTVESVIHRYKTQAVKSISSALDMKAISASVAAAAGGPSPGGIQRSGTPQLGAGSRARDGLWQRMAACMEQLHSNVVAVWHFQRVMSKKRDPISHAGFLDDVVQVGDPLLTERVWEAVVKSFASQMKSAFTASSFVKEIFVLGYPRLLGMVDNFLQRLVRDTDVKGVIPAIRDADREQLVSTLEPFHKAYLAQTLTRLTELVHASAIRGGIPSHDQVLKLVSRIQEEIEAARVDAGLTVAVLKEVGKVIQLFAEKSEYQIATGPESRQVTGPASPLQLKNFALCLHLQDLHQRLSSILPGLPPVAAEVLSPSLGAVYGVAVDTITPLFKAMVERLEKGILQMHEQDFNSDMWVDDDRPQYMQEIHDATLHFRSEFLSKLLPTPAAPSADSISVGFARKMASRVLLFFVRHAALVRPLSEAGKLRMARDMAELELLVGQNLFPVEQLGATYRALRAFRPFIFLDTSQILSSPLLQDLPPSVIFHHLYSRAPDELESPMKRSKLSPAQYSLWLDTHDDEQVWKEVKGTLDDYAARVKARGDKQFTPVYPIMLQLGSSPVLG